ncbi:DNA-binding protein [Bradyrhizobium vignae]|nr:DNA-binding protein [Bradyrhizobium vignae]
MCFSNSATTQDVDSTPCRQLTPRLLSRQQAAAYCNLSPSAFSAWVRSGKLPSPLAGTTRWDLKAIDLALDNMSGLQPQQETSALDEWRAKRARRSERTS